MRRLWLTSYDIADDRRRRRVEKTLLGLGDRVQESLFECPLAAERAATTADRLARHIEPGADRVSLLPLCRDCQRRSRFFGLGREGGLPRPDYTVV